MKDRKDIEKITEDVNAFIDKKVEKIHFTSKMSTKIAALIVLVVLIPIILMITIAVKNTTGTLESIYRSYAQNLAEEAVQGIDFAIELGETTYGNYAMDMAEEIAKSVDLQIGSRTADYNQLAKILDGVTIENVEGSYAYVVSDDGTMLYHPTKDKVGKSVENAAVKGIVEELKAGKTLENGFTIYEYKDAMKLAGYAFTKQGDIVIVTADYDAFMRVDYDSLIGKIEINGVAGSYAYMVSPDGTMLYHKDSEKIGKSVENAAVKGIVSKLQAGETVENGAVVYEYKGEDKLAGYAFASNGNIVVVTADYKTFIAPITKQRNWMVLLGAIMLVVFGIAGVIFASKLMKALELVIPSIKNTADLNFTYDQKNEKLCKRVDEIGLIAREIKRMQLSLGSIVNDIHSASQHIDKNVEELQDISKRVNEMCTVNSETSETLAAGMEETAATTMSITSNIGDMKDGAKDIERMTIDGADQSNDVRKRASELRESTEKATKSTMDIYTTVKERSGVAMEAAKSVQKINDLTNTVMGISSQTSLLALNASIEAARAGEAGRGFAVVATEISSLAVQTTDAVSSINTIVEEVNVAVGNMTACLKETMEFLETTVLKDYDNFGAVSVQYQQDADSFKDTMDGIKKGIVELNDTLEVIMESINGISDTMAEASSGVSDIAGKTMDMAHETDSTAHQVENCKQQVADLNEIVSKFTLGEAVESL